MKQLLFAILLMTTTLSACAQDSKDKETQVLISTTLGEITIKLYNETPIHRDNFIKLVKENYYDSVLFHRVIKEFMVQAGDPGSKGAAADVMLGAGDPGYTLQSEINFPKFFHKRGALCAARQGDQVNPTRRSSGSQFYIVTGKRWTALEMDRLEAQLSNQQLQAIFDSLCYERRDTIIALQEANDERGLNALQKELVQITKDKAAANPYEFSKEIRSAYAKEGGTPQLDGQYTVFGEVTKGMDVVELIEKAKTNGSDRPKEDIMIVSTRIIK